MNVFSDIEPLRAYVSGQKSRGRRVVFVPTMGALHDGHRACVDRGLAVDNGSLVLSIFVNPTQFGPNEDLNTYPRRPDEDLALCRSWGCDAVFTPETDTVYPSAQTTWVNVGKISEPLCGRGRPGHFRGVATVVAKLFNIVQPDVAVFGQKDAQQALVIKEMVEQLNLPVELLVAPTAREGDGLAMSSRNQHLDAEQRRRAVTIHRALLEAQRRLSEGVREAAELTSTAREDLAAGGIGDIEYVEILNASDLSSLDRIEGKVILAIAARLGAVRLIDNAVFSIGESGKIAETALF